MHSSTPPAAASVASWIREQLWSDGYFAPERLAPVRVLFSTGVRSPLLVNVIDGGPREHSWPQVTGSTSPTESLFVRLRPLVAQHPAAWVYITDPDNALSLVHWEREARAELFTPHVLEVFEREPAREGGLARLVLGFADRQGLLVFELGEEDLRILLYATPARRREVVALLGE